MKAFTLVEVLLSLAVIGLLTGIGIPVYRTVQVKNDLSVTVNVVVQTLRRAQILSQSVDGDISWGVKIQSSDITLFKGVSYATRDANFDEVFDMPLNVIPSGLDEIVFAKFSGLPQTTGTVTLTSSSGDAVNIIINVKGIITYE